jgi:predicted MFS family arabinose efflux permease
VLIAAVPVLLWSHHLVVADLYGIAAVSALLSSVTEVAEAALVARLLDDDQLDAANSLLSAGWELAYIVGPAMAGVIVATIGAPYALGCDAASFAVMSAICLALPALAPASPDAPADSGRGRRNWLGLGLLFRFPAVLVLSVCSFGMLLGDGIATVLYPVFSRSFLHAGATGYGILVSAAGVGALLGVVAVTRLVGRLPPALRIGTVLAAGAPLFALLRLAPDLAVAVILLGLASFAWGPYYVLERTLVQRLVPDDVRGRLFGVRMAISLARVPVGQRDRRGADRRDRTAHRHPRDRLRLPGVRPAAVARARATPAGGPGRSPGPDQAYRRVTYRAKLAMVRFQVWP